MGPVITNTLDWNRFEDMQEKLAAADQIIISKWDTNKSDQMLFQSDPEEVRLYMATVEDLQRLMESLSASGTNSIKLIQAQRVMKTAMARLQNELNKILLSNSDPLDPARTSSARSSFCSSKEDSVTRSTFSDGDDDGSRHSSARCSSTDRMCEFDMLPLEVVAYLQSIAQRMAKSGYARECVRVFVLCRKSVVEESLYNLGVDTVKLNDIRKMEWKFLDEKIRKWIYAAKISIRVVFPREKQLCAEVFEGLDMMRDSCFTEVAKERAERLVAFAEAVAGTSRSPERIFRVLGLYETLTDLVPDIEDTFSQDSCRSVREQGKRILVQLAEAGRAILMEFEKAVENEKSKAPIIGGNVHPLTRYVMNYLAFLSDYKDPLVNILADAPVALPDKELNDPYAALSDRMGWMVFVLMCKLDKKADLYKDVALSYLFLINNLYYIIQKVKGSELKYILGEEWIRKQWNKVRHYAVNYEKTAWMKVLSCVTDEQVPGNQRVSSGRSLKERLREFNTAMEEVKRRHDDGWIVADVSLREKLRVSVTQKLIPSYTSFLRRFRSQFESNMYIKYTPEEAQEFVLHVFKGNP